jgi:hypothetical protein
MGVAKHGFNGKKMVTKIVSKSKELSRNTDIKKHSDWRFQQKCLGDRSYDLKALCDAGKNPTSKAKSFKSEWSL